ncbi:MAG: protein kinase [Bryobacteraceae bacterium]|jgi:Tol biopolymer transport system component/predicted Ser/Thr protein kinase
MPLQSGNKLGPYELIAPIGKGGMGEVWKARDPRLDRIVALKVSDAQFSERFEREAKAIAALNHPNICTLHDVGPNYLVMEYIEGTPLKGPLPVDQALKYAVQICDALDAAHKKGITHRDLKPANILVTKAGIKLLDFGLAKLGTSGIGQAAKAPNDATLTMALTGKNEIVGTLYYMSPEQLQAQTTGKEIDGRSDIFSFGLVLFEMLTGKRAFEGTSLASVIAAIMERPTPSVADVAPAALDRALSRCLEKDPDNRWQSARDLKAELEWLASAPGEGTTATPQPPSWAKWLWPRVAALLALGAVIGAGAIYGVFRGAAPLERAELAIDVPGEVNQLALSPDGKWLAFTGPGETDGSPMVFVQRIGAAQARAIPESEGASNAFWSPDDQYVAFFSRGRLRKAALSGGAPQSIAAVGSGPRGGSWGSKGVILYAPDAGGGIWRVNADGSGAAAVTAQLVDAKDPSHRFPVFLPDGEHFLFLMYGGTSENEGRINTVNLSSLSKPGKTPLFHAKSSAVYADGQVYYADDNNSLVSVALDIAGAKVSGTPRVIAAKVACSPSTYYLAATAAENSTVVYCAKSAANHSQLTWFDESGRETGRVGPVGVIANPALSPDGKRAAYDSSDAKANNVDVWTLDLLNGGASRFTFAPEEEGAPVWSRDGSSIAYSSFPKGPPAPYVKRASGMEAPRRLDAVASDGSGALPTSWSPDDREILCTHLTSPGGATDLLILSVDASKMRPFLAGPGSRSHGQISPDGKWVAYASDETGESEIYVTTYPGANGKWQVSRAGGTEPRWRGDSKAVYYIAPKQMLTEAAVSTESGFSTTGTRPLFAIRARYPISYGDVASYDVTSDGKRFLVNQYIKPEQAPPLSIVLHAGRPPAR